MKLRIEEIPVRGTNKKELAANWRQSSMPQSLHNFPADLTVLSSAPFGLLKSQEIRSSADSLMCFVYESFKGTEEENEDTPI